MKAALGDIIKSKSTGESYRVKRIKEPVVLLEAEETPDKLWLGSKESLELLYDRVDPPKELDFSSAG